MTTLRPRALPALLLLAMIMLFIDFPGAHLFDPDEARYAEIPQAMLLSGDWVTPKLNGSNYFEKPPLLYWLNASAFRVFGVSAFSARLASRVSTLASAVLIAWAIGGEAGLWGALVFLLSLLPFAVGRLNLTDAPLTAGLTMSLAALVRMIADDTPRRTALFWTGVAVAFLSKGLVAFVIPAGTVLIWSVHEHSTRLIRRVLHPGSIMMAAAAVAPWFVLMEIRNPGFSWFFFIHEHFLRYATNEAQRPGSVLYFIPILLLGLLPWTPVFLSAAANTWRARRGNTAGAAVERLLLSWCAVVFGFFSLSHSKLIPYIMPLFPAATALSGLHLSRRAAGRTIPLVLSGIAAATFMGLVAAAPLVAQRRSFHDIGVRAAAEPNAHVVAYRFFPHGVALALKKPIPVVDGRGELASDNRLAPDLFWSRERLSREWKGDKRLLVVMRRKDWDGFRRDYGRAFVLADNGRAMLAANRPPQHQS